MSQSGESSDTKLAEVLADVPDELLPIMDKIVQLTDPQFQPIVADILRLVPHDLLFAIMRSKPDSKVRIIECINNAGGTRKRVRYASWIRRGLIPKCLEGVNWSAIMGAVANQLDHDICWAIVASELIRAVRLIDGRDTDPNIRYSSQDLIDFTEPVERGTSRRDGHYCYTSSINRGMRYVMKNGILREEDRPFVGCPQEIPDRALSQFGYIKDFKRLQSMEEMLLQLKHQPIGAAVAMFYPEYNDIGDKIYRGPVLERSRLVGLHAVSLLRAGEENGERYVEARSSHGDEYGNNGNLRISLDVLFLYIPTPGEEVDEGAKKYFSEPSPLICRFSYPRLHTRDEEERLKAKHEARLARLASQAN